MCFQGYQSCPPEATKMSPMSPKYVADASKIFSRRVQGFRHRVQRFHRRRSNAADAINYPGCHLAVVVGHRATS